MAHAPPAGERQFPRRGDLICNFALLSAAGKQVEAADYRGRSNLILVFAGQGSGPELALLLR